MRLFILFVGILYGMVGFGQDQGKNMIIPYLCDNGKYRLADSNSNDQSECIFDSLSLSRSDVTLGFINGDAHFVNKNGIISNPISDYIHTPFGKIMKYKRLSGDNEFYIYTKRDTSFIYDKTHNICFGPLLPPVSSSIDRLGFYSDFMDNPRPYVFYTKEDKQIIISKHGKSLELPSTNPESYQIKDEFLFYIGQNGESSKIYNCDFDELVNADTFEFSSGLRPGLITANKGNKKFQISINQILDIESNDRQSTVSLKEIPLSWVWESNGYTYHENDSFRWLEDENGEVFYSLEKDEKLIPYLDNILSFKGQRRKFLLGDSSLLITQPHISFSSVGNKYILQNKSGYYILDKYKKVISNQVYKEVNRVDQELFCVEYENENIALLDNDLNLILNSEYKIVKKFIGESFVYQIDSLYGLLDSIGNKIKSPLSTRSDFYVNDKLEWIKIYEDDLSYIYNVQTQKRTEGLNNEFRFTDRYHDEDGRDLILSSTYGIDSTFFYRQDGSLFDVVSRKETQYFQKEKHRYTRKEISRNNYVYVDRMNSDTLLTCNDCDGMYLIYPNQDYKVEYVICSYQNIRKDLYNKRGERLLPDGMSMLRSASMDNELSYFPEIIVQKNHKIGVYNIETKKQVIPIVYDNITRHDRDRLSLRLKGKNQITDLKGIPVNNEYYYRTHSLTNGDIAAQFPMKGTHKKKVYFDPNDPDMDPCEGKVIDAPNYYYKIIDKEGRSRFDRKFVKYVYKSDDLISVSEWTGKDTIHYCMNIKGDIRKKTKEYADYSPKYSGIVEMRQGWLLTFLDEDLNQLVNRKFNSIDRLKNEDGSVFYVGSDSTSTYVYDQNFQQTAKVPGSFYLTRFGTTMMFLYDYDVRDVWLLNMDGSLFYNGVLKGIGRGHRGGMQAYRKEDKLVYVDLLNVRKYWD